MPGDLVKSLAQAGHRVDVICSDDEVFDLTQVSVSLIP
jgi:hypothetical protein